MNRGPAAARQASLREHNMALVARSVFESPGVRSRADISALTGLTRATVSALVDRLIGAGIVRELAPLAPVRAGRPAVPLAPAIGTFAGLGLEANVDYLGGRVVDLSGAEVASRIDAGSFANSDVTQVLARLGGLARDLLTAAERADVHVAGARLALPGLVDANSGRLRIAPNLGWSDVDPAPLLGLGELPVTVVNEAKLAALAQLAPDGTLRPSPDDPAPPTPDQVADRLRAGRRAQSEAAPPAASYLYVSGDVGIGSAIVVRGELFYGTHGWAGEVGHVVVDPHGPVCSCGSRGCLEQYAGKNAIWRAAGFALDAPLEEVVGSAEDGNPVTLAALSGAGRAMGQALAGYVNLVDIDTVLFGGIYAALLPYLRFLRGELTRGVLAAPWALPTAMTAPIADHAATTGGAGEVLRDVIDNPTLWIASDSD